MSRTTSLEPETGRRRSPSPASSPPASSAPPSSGTTSSCTASPPRWSSRTVFFPTRRTRCRRPCCPSRTYAIGFVVRPLGGLVFGHFGDKLGRKKLLVVCLLMMGVATFAIGLLPSHATVGVLAPVLLTVLRLIQGFALGGEWGGAVLIVSEHGEPAQPRLLGLAGRRRAYPPGKLLANGVLALLAAGPERRDLPRLGLAHPVPAVRGAGHRRAVDPAAGRGVADLPCRRRPSAPTPAPPPASRQACRSLRRAAAPTRARSSPRWAPGWPRTSPTTSSPSSSLTYVDRPSCTLRQARSC